MNNNSSSIAPQGAKNSSDRKVTEKELRAKFEKPAEIFKGIAGRLAPLAAKDPAFAPDWAEVADKAAAAAKLAAIGKFRIATTVMWRAVTMGNKLELPIKVADAQKCIDLAAVLDGADLTEAKAELAKAQDEKQLLIVRLRAAGKAGYLARQARREIDEKLAVENAASRQAWVDNLGLFAQAQAKGQADVKQVLDRRFRDGRRVEIKKTSGGRPKAGPGQQVWTPPGRGGKGQPAQRNLAAEATLAAAKVNEGLVEVPRAPQPAAKPVTSAGPEEPATTAFAAALAALTAAEEA